jgi:hypothetical protein
MMIGRFNRKTGHNGEDHATKRSIAEREQFAGLQGRVKLVFNLGADRPEVLNALIQNPDSAVETGKMFAEMVSLARDLEHEHGGVLSTIMRRIGERGSSGDGYLLASKLTAAELLGFDDLVRSLKRTYLSRSRHPSSGVAELLDLPDTP